MQWWNHAVEGSSALQAALMRRLFDEPIPSMFWYLIFFTILRLVAYVGVPGSAPLYR